MQLNPLGRSGLKISAVTLGTMNFGSDWHGVGAIDAKTASSLIDAALDAGVNALDTADIYGRGAAETMLGKILGARRRRLILATKVLGQMRPGDPSSGGLSRRHIIEAAEDSLRRLKTDRIDMYMPHGMDFAVPGEESHEAFDRLARDGKIRALGCSNFSGAELQGWLAQAASRGWARPEFDQVQYSLAAPLEGDLLSVCRAGDVSVLAWSPLGGGFLTGKYAGGAPGGGRRDQPAAFPGLPEARLGGVIDVLRQVARLEGMTPAQAALGWVTSRPCVASAVVGARTVAQLQETLAARAPSARAAAFLDKASSLCSSR